VLRQQETIQPTPPGPANHSKHNSKNESGTEAPRRPRGVIPEQGEKDPDSWSSRLHNIYLSAGAPSPYQHSPGSQLSDDELHLEILDNITGAEGKRGAGRDILTYMGIEQGRWKAVLWLANTLIENLSTRMLSPRNAECPSNIAWGDDQFSLESLTRRPFSVEAAPHASPRTIEASTTFEPDLKYTVAAADTRDPVLRTMKQIWKSLGCLIIEAADLQEQQSDVTMAVVYQIIAKLHALGLVPDNVYSYESSGHSSMVSRPPILHLLSSRVLTTLSDATWRSHQMEVIEQAVSTGISLQSLVKDLPGGRFRLKVRPLGHEIWLEFVLWCCVEGGFGSTGVALVKQLQQKVENPWFAIPWTSKTGNALSSPIDWERVHSRHGGSVGLIEGYNRERPFVEMAPRTVSAEVVMMLVETMTNSVNTGVAYRSLRLDGVVMHAIPRLIRFLEPHSLPGEYFDYLAVRILQTGAFDIEQNPSLLEKWSERLSKLRSLESTVEATPATATFEVSSIIQQSEVQVGILHQALEAYVEKFNIRSAITVFNRIQELVDVSKVQSISAFLATTSAYATDSASDHVSFPEARASNLDFVRSHGQLPLHKLAAFLNLTTDSKLFRIGEWLLSSQEVDEAVIPQRLFDRPALTTALVRYAGASDDEALVASVIGARSRSPLLLSVSLLRSLVDALISFYNFGEASKVLTRLRDAKGGGHSPKNLASSVAAILTLTSRDNGAENVLTDVMLAEAWRIMSWMMNGRYSGRTDTFRVDVLATYRQQLAALFMVMSKVPHPQISSFGRTWMNKYPLSNLTILATDTFNVVLAGVVDTKGAEEGMKLCQFFCDDLSSESSTSKDPVVMDDILAGEDILADDIDYNWAQRPRSAVDRVATSSKYVPFVDSLAPGERADSRSEERTEIEKLEFAKAFPVEADEIADPEPEAMLLVRADLRTLRIVVQGALAERRARKEEGSDTSSQLEVLQWAAQFYRRFGTSTEVIEQEIRLPVADSLGGFERQRIRAERKLRLEFAAAAAAARNNKLGHVYKQFHGWRPVTGMR
jgi:hypothetical protein